MLIASCINLTHLDANIGLFTSNNVLPARAQYGHIHGLDGMRAFAVLIVIIAHMGITSIIPGGFGVTVFFFISGFLITRLLLAEREKNGTVNLNNFYIRRFLRLLPALFLMMATSALIMIAMSDPPLLREAIAGFSYFMNYNNIALGFQGIDQTSPWGHLWSLAVEEHFYLLFPLLIVSFGRNIPKVIRICITLCAFALIWRIISFYATDFPRDYNYFATETRIDSILFGCLLSLMLHFKPQGNWKDKLTGWFPTLSAAFILLSCFIAKDEGFRQMLRYSYQGFALFIAVLNLYYFKPLNIFFTILDFAPLRWIGRLSYGLYLWHIPAMYFCNNYMGLSEGSFRFVLASLAITFIAATISYYGFETKVIALRKKFGAHIVTAKPKTAPTS